MGFQLYHLYSQTLAFAILLIITGFTIVLALGYNKKSLAIFALIGGFASPFMVATGSGNYKVLFSYILILNTGMMVLAYFKKWNIVNLLTLIFTMILYAAWLTDLSTSYGKVIPYLGALFFASLFYITFFLMFIVNNIKEGTKFKVFDMMLLMSATFGFYGAGMYLLDGYKPELKGIFSLSIALFNFAFAYPLYKKCKVDKNLVFMLIAVVLTLVSATAPAQLNGQYITIFWAIESVVLLWLSQKSGILLIRIGASIVFLLSAISLYIDWHFIYFNANREINGQMPIIFNKGFITGITVVLSMITNLILLQKDKQITLFKNLPHETFRLIVTSFVIVFMYFVFLFELTYQLDNTFIHSYAIKTTLIDLFNFSYVFGILLWATIKQIKIVLPIMAGFSFLCALLFTTSSFGNYSQLLFEFFHEQTTQTFYFYKLLTALIVSAGVTTAWVGLSKMFGKNKPLARITLWLSTLWVIVIFSQELLHISLFVGNFQFTAALTETEPYLYNDTLNAFLEPIYRIGFPVLWGAFSFLLIVGGMKFKFKDMRIIALAIFLVTVVKLFAYDIWHMSQLGRVISFISLGILLLIVAFLYQKLKKIFVGEEFESKKNNIQKEINTQENIKNPEIEKEKSEKLLNE